MSKAQKAVEKSATLTAAEKKEVTQPTAEEKAAVAAEPRKEDGVIVSSFGVQMLPKGEHPRDKRKEKKDIGEVPAWFRAGYDAYLKEVGDDRVVEQAKDNDGRGMYLFQQAVAGIVLENFGLSGTASQDDHIEYQEAFPAAPAKKAMFSDGVVATKTRKPRKVVTTE